MKPMDPTREDGKTRTLGLRGRRAEEIREEPSPVTGEIRRPSGSGAPSGVIPGLTINRVGIVDHPPGPRH